MKNIEKQLHQIAVSLRGRNLRIKKPRTPLLGGKIKGVCVREVLGDDGWMLQIELGYEHNTESSYVESFYLHSKLIDSVDICDGYNLPKLANFKMTDGTVIKLDWSDDVNEMLCGYELLPGKNGKMPLRATKYSAGTDIFSSERTVIPARGIALVPTGITMYMIERMEGILDCRSGLPIKRGLTLANGRGTIDADFYGEEIKVQLLNLTDEEIIVEAGERIAQGKFYVVSRPYNEQIADEERKSGFHSTGIN